MSAPSMPASATTTKSRISVEIRCDQPKNVIVDDVVVPVVGQNAQSAYRMSTASVTQTSTITMTDAEPGFDALSRCRWRPGGWPVDAATLFTSEGSASLLVRASGPTSQGAVPRV